MCCEPGNFGTRPSYEGISQHLESAQVRFPGRKKMKNIKFSRLFAAALLVACFAFAGCKQPINNYSVSVIGNWGNEYENWTITATSFDAGAYSYAGNNLVIVMDDEKSGEKAIAAAYPDYSVRRAFTAQIIINHVQARDDEHIDNMEQALERAINSGVKNLIVQPTHLMHARRSESMGFLLSLCSGPRESCAQQMTGTDSSFAIIFRLREMSATSCTRLSMFFDACMSCR